MAVPRVFISSTFYDLQQVRDDLARFLQEIGFEPVRHEAGLIPYGDNLPLEAYAYLEVELCDILVSIVGGRFGSESKNVPNSSVSHVELRTALERGIQVFIFVDRNVHAEYQTYLLNKTRRRVSYRSVDDVRVFRYLEELYSLPRNNPIVTFELASDITVNLRLQLAGLLHRSLRERRRLSELKVLDEMKSVASTLQQLVDFLTEERKGRDESILNILRFNNPALRRLIEAAGGRHMVLCGHVREVNSWLGMLGWQETLRYRWSPGSHREWHLFNDNVHIKVLREIFDAEGNLKIFTPSEWKDEWIVVERRLALGDASTSLRSNPFFRADG